MTKESDNKRQNKTTNEKPISLHPLDPEDVLKALLVTPPPKEQKSKKKSARKNKPAP